MEYKQGDKVVIVLDQYDAAQLNEGQGISIKFQQVKAYADNNRFELIKAALTGICSNDEMLTDSHHRDIGYTAVKLADATLQALEVIDAKAT